MIEKLQVRAAAACNASPSMESQCQLVSYFRYPLVTGILDLAETCPIREALYWRWIAKVSAIHFTTASVVITFIWHKEELFCEWEIGSKQPWNFSVEIKFAAVKFSLVLIFVDATYDKNFLTAKISRITVYIGIMKVWGFWPEIIHLDIFFLTLWGYWLGLA